MSATISQRPMSSTSETHANVFVKPDLIQKVEGQVARIIAIRLLTVEEGFLTIGEDKTLRVILRRDSGQFWPSAIEYLPNVPTCLYLDEASSTAYVGLVTGALHQCSLGEDMNKIDVTRRWLAHSQAVTGVVYSSVSKELFSCGRDKNLVWYSEDLGIKLGNYTIDAACTTMQFDATTNFAFVGDSSGSVFVLRITGNSAQMISKLSAHTSAITDLAWDSTSQLLFSSSTDSLVLIWDIGARKGECYELNGHDSKVCRLSLSSSDASKLFSVDDSGHLVCWDLKAKRIMTPAWKDSDRCEICDTPFFWNLKVMWDRRTVGVRRHHCRTCGYSSCSNCCNNFTAFPAMGFEKRVRICNNCNKKMETYPEQFDLTPRAAQCELRQGVIDMQIDKKNGRLITVGYDRAIMVWNVSPLLK